MEGHYATRAPSIRQRAQEKFDNKTKPVASLGRLETLAVHAAEIQDTLTPSMEKPSILVFAADHGISRESVSAFPQEVTKQMVLNFVSGGAAISVLCRLHDIQLKVVNAGVNGDLPVHSSILAYSMGKGTRNFLSEPAMSAEEAAECLNRGREIVEQLKAEGCNTVGFGEMGIGNSSSAALLTHRFTKKPLAECTGRGTGLDDARLAAKLQILTRANEAHAPDSATDVLRTFGGFEIAMMTGAMLRAAELKMILLVDGFISTAAMLAAHALRADVLGNALFCHKSAEGGHRHALEFLGARPILDLEMRLGEGTGCALAVPILRSSIALLNEMASFESAGVSREQSS